MPTAAKPNVTNGIMARTTSVSLDFNENLQKIISSILPIGHKGDDEACDKAGHAHDEENHLNKVKIIEQIVAIRPTYTFVKGRAHFGNVGCKACAESGTGLHVVPRDLLLENATEVRRLYLRYLELKPLSI
jgi:hypothetical protein